MRLRDYTPRGYNARHILILIVPMMVFVIAMTLFFFNTHVQQVNTKLSRSFAQELILGVGGVRMLRALGYDRVDRFHLNEGHSSLLALELFAEELARPPGDRNGAIERTKRKCVFTTHTPVPAGHDRFPLDLARGVLGAARVNALEVLGCCDSELNMTRVGLTLSHYVNGVSKRHGEVSHSMFPNYPIGSITNGVHSATWTAPAFADLYDGYIPGWRKDSFSLRYAIGIPPEVIRQAHRETKRQLIAAVNERTASFEVESPLAMRTNAGENLYHLRLGEQRVARTVRVADQLLVELDPDGTLAGCWLVGVPPFPNLED